MIIQNIDALKLTAAMLKLSAESGRRHSLLDQIALLYIFSHPDCGKLDISEYIYGDRTASKSSLDKPVLSLIEAGFVSRTDTDGSTKAGNTKVIYRSTKAGEKFLAKQVSGKSDTST